MNSGEKSKRGETLSALPTPGEWLTVKAAARLIAASPSFVRKLIQLGRLVAVNIGVGAVRSEWRISREEVARFMRAASTSGGDRALS